MKHKTSPLRLADGVVLPAARPVSPFSLRGLAGAAGGAYNGLRGAATNAIETVATPFQRPPGYTPAAAPALAAAPAVQLPSPGSQTQLGGMNLAVIQQREAAAGLRDGSPFVRGPGGPTDDKIPAKLSHGEAVLPADTVDALGAHNVQAVIDQTHTPVKSKGLRHYANGIPGIDVKEVPWGAEHNQAFPDSAQAQAAEAAHAARVNPAPQPSNFESPGYQDHFEVLKPAAAAPGVAADPTKGRMFNMGRAGGAAVANVGSAAGGFLNDAGRAAAELVKPVAGKLLNAAGDATHILPHMGVYGSDASWGDKARIGASDAVQFLATGAGAAVGGGFGSAVAPGPGTIAGGLTGGTLGSIAGQWAGNKLFDRDAALSRSGFDPTRNVVDFAGDLAHGDGWEAATGGKGLRNAGGGRGFVNMPQGGPVAAPGAAAAVAPGAAAGSAGPETDAQRGGASPIARADLNQDTGIYQRGNSFSNTGTYAEDMGPNRNGGKISEQNSQAADNLSARYAGQGGLRGGGMPDPNLPAGAGATIPGMNAPASQAEAELAARNATVKSTTGPAISPRTQVAMRNADIAERGQQMQNDTARRGQDVNAESARASNRATMRGQDLNYGATTRGQDVTERGQDMTARTAGNAARIQQRNFDDQHNLNVQKYGLEKANAMYSQRSQAEKDQTAQLETMHTTTDPKTGAQVVDHAKVAESKAALNSYLGTKIDNLERVPQSSPDYAASQQLAQQLREQGPQSIGADRMQNILREQEIKQRIKDAHGQGPFSGKFVESSDPGAYDIVGKKSGWFQNQYVTRNGSEAPTRTLDYDAGGNAILPNYVGNHRTDRFNTVKKGDLRNGN